MALVAATALHPGDYFAINATPAVYQTLKDSTGAPMQPVHLPDLEKAGRRKRRRSDWRRRVAGHRHGRHLQPSARYARPDGVLVPLRDHVRGAVHPDDDRRGDEGGPLRLAGVHRPRLQAVRAHRLAARLADLDVGDLPGVGLLHLDRQHRHDLADVRRLQPAAGRRRARGRHDHPDQSWAKPGTRG